MFKKIPISSKRQITIPDEFFEILGFEYDAVCELQEDGIVIRPIKHVPSGEFDDLILADLIKEGYEGEELLEKFKERRRQIRPAFIKMLEDCEKEAKPMTLEELFGTDEE